MDKIQDELTLSQDVSQKAVSKKKSLVEGWS